MATQMYHSSTIKTSPFSWNPGSIQVRTELTVTKSYSPYYLFRGPHSGTAYFDDVMLWPSTGNPICFISSNSPKQTSGIPKGIYPRDTKLSLCHRSAGISSAYGYYREHPFFLKAEKDPVCAKA